MPVFPAYPCFGFFGSLSLSLSLTLTHSPSTLSISLCVSNWMSFFRQVHSSWTRPEGQTLWERCRERARRGVRQLDERVFCLSAHFCTLFSPVFFSDSSRVSAGTGRGKDREIVQLAGALVSRLDQHLF